MSKRKGLTNWFPRHITPVRTGEYECIVRISRAVPPLTWRLRWDGKGFIVPVPMMVSYWRGMTKEAHKKAAKVTT